MSEYIRTQRTGHLGEIQLDRPRALNALDLGMCSGLHRALDEFVAEESVIGIMVTSTSDKAFCAGGDIKAVREAAVRGDFDECRRYFDTEYAMNLAIATCPKPYLAVMHGATMGGGLGVSAHGKYRVVTDTLMTSMPETAIGFVPDVGASWLLPRLAGGGERGLALAIYLGLTGARMGAADALYTGLATHYISDQRRPELLSALGSASTAADIELTLGQFCEDPSQAGQPRLSEHLDRIEQIFSEGQVPDFVAALQEGEQDQFAQETLAAVASMSPTSMVATVELFRLGARAASVADCLNAEAELGAWMCRQPDFVEGVRAVLVDKTKDASWTPKDAAEVDLAGIRSALDLG